ncbi:MAG: TolC family protein [Bacteroidales bacterium]|nr:TolC family protein [Bacteroidales bacterium]MBP3254776.1 TolC family protein [Bacteroidales bacterium]
MKKFPVILSYTLFILLSGITYAQDYLNAYINIGIANSPQLKSIEYEISSTKEKISSEAALNDMELSLSVLPEPMMNVNGEQVATVSLMQMFPWPGTLASSAKEMKCMTESKTFLLQQTKAELQYKIETSYYDMVLVQYETLLIQQRLTLLSNIEKNFLSKYVSQMPDAKSKSAVPNLINIQLQQEELSLQLEILKDNLATAKRKFNILLHRNETEEILLADSVIEYPFTIYNYENILNKNPELGMLNAQKQAGMHGVEMQKRMSYPMIGVGVEYMINKQTDNPKMEDMNGKNMFMAMFKVSMPVFRKKYNSAINSAKFKTRSIEQQYEQKTDNIKNEIISLEQNYINLKKKLVLYTKQTSLLQEKINILNTAYTASQSSVTDILETEEKLLDYKLKTATTVTEINKTTAKLKTFISEEL